MHHRIAGILTGAVALSLVASGIAVADSVSADADVVVAGDQGLINLGTVAPGSSHQVQIAFDLLCTGTSHSAVNSTITLTPTATAPTGGSISATPGTIGPVPPTWPGAGAPCVDDPVLRSSTPSTVTLTAPLTAGTNIIYRVTYTKAPSSGISGGTLAQIALSVNANAAPELDLPGTMTVEGDTTGGWVAAYTATATDAEDDPDPAADCTPAPGVLLRARHDHRRLLRDRHRRRHRHRVVRRSTSWTRRRPTSGRCRRPRRATEDPGGAAVTFATPSANDVVDPSPAVGCLPVSGSTFAVGTTTVTCTATDASGNSAIGHVPGRRELRAAAHADPDPDPDAHADADPDADPDAHADAHADADPDARRPRRPRPRRPRPRRPRRPRRRPTPDADPHADPDADPVGRARPRRRRPRPTRRRRPPRPRPGWASRGTGPSATGGRSPASAGRCR